MPLGPALKSLGKGTPHVVVHHTPSGPKVYNHPTKAAAMEHAKSIRASGGNSYIFSKSSFQSLQGKIGYETKDEGGSGEWDESKHPRDDQGKFT